LGPWDGPVPVARGGGPEGGCRPRPRWGASSAHRCSRQSRSPKPDPRTSKGPYARRTRFEGCGRSSSTRPRRRTCSMR